MEKKKIAQEFFKKLSQKNFKNFFTFLEDNRCTFTILKFLNETEKEILAGDISKSLNLSTARVAVALSSLEKKGLIEKVKSNEDARKTIVNITPNGVIALDERQNKIINKINSLLENLSIKDSKILLEIISKLITPSENLA